MNNYKLLYSPKIKKGISIWKKNIEESSLSIFNNQIEIIGLNVMTHSNFDVTKFDLKINRILDVANDFINENNLSPYVVRGCNLINKIMKKNAFDYDIIIDITKDIESHDWKALRILVEVFDVKYANLLNIWNGVTTQFYSELDPENSKKIYIIFRKKKKRVTYVV